MKWSCARRAWPSYGCCVVCLGSDNMQESILVTLTLKELGIPKIVARASSEQHRKVLTKVGADMVVFPEKDMGRKLAYTLAKTDVFEFINFSKDHSIVELKTPRRWAGKAIKDLDVRKRYGVNIIAISKAGSSDDFEIFTDPDRVLAPEETLVIIGGNEEIGKNYRKVKINLAICANSGIIKFEPLRGSNFARFCRRQNSPECCFTVQAFRDFAEGKTRPNAASQFRLCEILPKAKLARMLLHGSGFARFCRRQNSPECRFTV